MSNIIVEIIKILLSAGVGYLIKYYLDKKAQLSSKTSDVKRKAYESYVKFYLSTIDEINAINSKKIDKQDKDKALEKINMRIQSSVREFYNEAILCASPRVMNAFADMMQYSYRNGKNKLYTMVFLTNVFKQMRRDVGLSNRGLGSGGIRLFRITINDYDKAIGVHEPGLLPSAKHELMYLNNESSKL